ncbi:hypothetical protein FS837_006509 [Tulasnella sp. UAMH 9824]|nr:hypothetical protein FS837_006509 [Tulasnella sp. UAMH 9824]
MLTHDEYSIGLATLSMIVMGDIPFWSRYGERAWAALWHVFEDKYDETIVELVALIISTGFPISHSASRDVRTLVQSAWSGKDVLDILLEATRCGPIALCKHGHPSYKDALLVFSEILRCLGELPSTLALIRLHPGALLPEVACLILAADEVYRTTHSSGVVGELGEFMAGALRLLRVCNPPGQSAPLVFGGTLAAFIRESDFDFVTGRTFSFMMWGLEIVEPREDMVQLVYAYTSKWFGRVGDHQFREWLSKGLVVQSLNALATETSTGIINLMVPVVSRHVNNRATLMPRELQESEETIRVGIDVVNSVNSNTGPMGQAYSLLTFEIVLSIWETVPEEMRSKKISEGMVEATTRILTDIDELLDNRPYWTLTDALRSKIGTTVCPEPFNLSPAVLQRFVSERTAKKADICTICGLGAIVNRLYGRFFDDTALRARI